VTPSLSPAYGHEAELCDKKCEISNGVFEFCENLKVAMYKR
jgi:hypothetical protein